MKSVSLRACLVLAALALSFGCGGARRAPLDAPGILPGPLSTSPRSYASPAVEFRAEPENILQGQTAVLSWTSTDADTAWLEPDFGRVEPQGQVEVRPAESASYSLTVQGPGGDRTVSARVFVSPADPLAHSLPRVESEDLLPSFGGIEQMAAALEDVYYDYNSDALSADAMRALDHNAGILGAFFQDAPAGRVVVEGHCDERGSSEYNLALGDRRASTAYEFLLDAGVPADRLLKVSYGKENPQCREPNEGCWKLNRRAHFAAAR